jgi:hypothetical protein
LLRIRLVVELFGSAARKSNEATPMVRIGLALCLLLATTPGPWRFCCMTNRMLASADKPTSNAAYDHSCCVLPADYPGTERAGAPSPCSCRDVRTNDMLATNSASEEAGANLRFEHFSFAETPQLMSSCISGLGLSTGSRSVADSTLLPFPSSEDLLFVCHILRC